MFDCLAGKKRKLALESFSVSIYMWHTKKRLAGGNTFYIIELLVKSQNTWDFVLGFFFLGTKREKKEQHGK